PITGRLGKSLAIVGARWRCILFRKDSGVFKRITPFSSAASAFCPLASRDCGAAMRGMTIPPANNNTIIRIIIHIVQKEIFGGKERSAGEKRRHGGFWMFSTGEMRASPLSLAAHRPVG